MRRNMRSLCLVCLVVLLGLPASAQLSTTQIEIIPPNPTTNDEITFRLSGTWPDACVPMNPQTARSGRLIVIATSNSATACAQVLTPWSLTATIGRLPAGTYQLAMTYNRQVVRSTVFTVTGGSDGGGPLTAHITTDRGCLDEGSNPVYFPGEKIGIQIRVDGADEAIATIENVLIQPDRREIRVIYRQVIPGNRTISVGPGDVGPILGKQTLRLTAQAGDRFDQDECTFTVAPLPTPEIDVSPTSLEFGEVPAGSRAQRLLTLRNVGQSDLVLGAIEIQSGFGSHFDFCGGTPSTAPLRPGEARQIPVCFTPRAAGTIQDAVLIRTNDPDEGTVIVALSGRGAAPPAPEIDVSPTSLEFGDVTVGSRGQRLLTLRNVGQADLLLGAIEIQSGFGSPFDFCVATPSTGRLRPGEAREVTICFAPPAAGTVQDAVLIRTNDPDEGTVAVPLSGRGVVSVPGVGTARIEILPPDPTTGDEITIRLSGTWPNSCVPSSPQVSRSDSQILIGTSNPSLNCRLVPVDWSLTAPLGRLPAGSYRVTMTYNQQAIQEAGFTVRDQSTAAPAAQTLLVVTGSVANGHLGAVVGGAGDANGDGRGDFLVGTESFLTAISGATGQPLYSIPATSPGDFDHAMAFSVSDLDGDARGEIVVAAPHADPEGLVDAGALYVFSGATGQRLGAVPGAAAEAQFGASAALLGDITGDGKPEVVVGAPGAAAESVASAGSVAIVSLADGAILRTIPGAVAGDRFGAAVAALDDLDGDGLPDIAVGAPLRDPAAGPDSGIVEFLATADGRVLFSVEGAEPNTRLGSSLARAGDLNGDGRADVIIGGPGRAVGSQAGAGVVFVYSVADRRALFRLDGAAAGDGFGSVVAGGGDVNGDGALDILVGAPMADVEGRVDAGLVRVYSGTDARLLFGLAGNAGDQLGTSAAFAGDVNADRRADVILGAPFFDAVAGPDAGQAIVVGLPVPPFQPIGGP